MPEPDNVEESRRRDEKQTAASSYCRPFGLRPKKTTALRVILAKRCQISQKNKRITHLKWTRAFRQTTVNSVLHSTDTRAAYSVVDFNEFEKHQGRRFGGLYFKSTDMRPVQQHQHHPFLPGLSFFHREFQHPLKCSVSVL